MGLGGYCVTETERGVFRRNGLEDLLKCRLLGPTPSVSDSKGLNGARVCGSIEFPGGA